MSWRRVLVRRSRGVLVWIGFTLLGTHALRGTAPEVSEELARSGILFVIAALSLPLLALTLNWSLLADSPALFAHRRRGWWGRWSHGGRALGPGDWGLVRSGHGRRGVARREFVVQVGITAASALAALAVGGVHLHGWWLASALVWSWTLCSFFFLGAAWFGRAGLLALAFLVGPLLMSARGGLPLPKSSDLAHVVRRIWGLVPEATEGSYLASLLGLAAGALLLGWLAERAIPR